MRVYNIPASAPFLKSLVSALIEGRLVEGFDARSDPERLAEVTLYLPTQRATREVRSVFLEVLKRDAAILPRVVALGEIDEDELAFAEAIAGTERALEIPPAIGRLERRLQLARLISFWSKQKAVRGEGSGDAPLVVGGPSSALAMADELGRLMDDITTRGVSWDGLKQLVPDDLDRYWQLSLDFLMIASEVWPKYLAAGAMIEPAARRDLLIAAEAGRLAGHNGPVIAAGSTGSMPATAGFLHAIARLRQGAVVLPGLDTELDERAWTSIGRDDRGAGVPGHPQFAMQGLLKQFGIKRSDVVELVPPAGNGRETLTSELMRPSDTTSDWNVRLRDVEVTKRIAKAMSGVAVIEAPGPEMEALAIAVAMREARQENLTAALVTPDRALARRVQAALGRWNLVAEDSRGEALLGLPAGTFARLAALVVAERLAPAPLLSLLKHPLFRLGRRQGGWRMAIETLELALLRGPRPAAGSTGLATGLAGFRAELRKLMDRQPSALHRSEPRANIRLARLDDVAALVNALGTALAPLEQTDRHATLDLRDIARRHREVIETLSLDDAGSVAAFEGDDGTSLAAAFDELLAQTEPSGLATALADYPDVIEATLGDRIVRSYAAATSALRIYGPLESRLTACDRVIVGGLVEGTWPPEPRNDPWLSRPMRQALGLDLPERRIGLAAHDFAQLVGAREVILSHAAKVKGSPTVPSRFLHRLQAVVGAPRWSEARAKGQVYLDLAASLDHCEVPRPIAQPAPKPPFAARPAALSVTEIEDWLRDPYTIYARHVLDLPPLDAVDTPLSAANRGTLIHNAIGEFTQTFPRQLPDRVVAVLEEIGARHFADFIERPEARALWWPRFLRIAGWFARWEQDRRAHVADIQAETRGSLTVPFGERSFTLSARADRIERRDDGSFAILDYKTGAPPSAKQVSLGLSPQMTLEAAILKAGGFTGIPSGSLISELTYVRLSGNEPPGEPTVLALTWGGRKDAPMSPDEAADYTRRKLEELVRKFENVEQAYTSLNLPMWDNRYGDYDNLSRIKEWSALGGKGLEDF